MHACTLWLVWLGNAVWHRRDISMCSSLPQGLAIKYLWARRRVEILIWLGSWNCVIPGTESANCRHTPFLAIFSSSPLTEEEKSMCLAEEDNFWRVHTIWLRGKPRESRWNGNKSLSGNKSNRHLFLFTSMSAHLCLDCYTGCLNDICKRSKVHTAFRWSKVSTEFNSTCSPDLSRKVFA